MGAFESFFSCCADIASLDRAVNVTDLLLLLATWGACPDPCQYTPTCEVNSPDTCPADIVRNCDVNVTDLLSLLAVWGSVGSGSGVCAPCLEPMDPSLASTQFPWLQGFEGQSGPVSDTWTSTMQDRMETGRG